MSIHRVRVTQWVDVEMDDSKFDAAFMREFVGSFYSYDTIPEHACHLGQLHARGLAYDGDFIEGYGLTDDMGIKFRVVDQEEEIEVLP